MKFYDNNGKEFDSRMDAVISNIRITTDKCVSKFRKKKEPKADEWRNALKPEINRVKKDLEDDDLEDDLEEDLEEAPVVDEENEGVETVTSETVTLSLETPPENKILHNYVDISEDNKTEE